MTERDLTVLLIIIFMALYNAICGNVGDDPDEEWDGE